MGLRTSWIAVKGLERASVLNALGVVETGELEGMACAPMAVATTPAGWVVVHCGEYGEFDRNRAVDLFPDAEAVGGQSSETVMVSDAYGLQAGQVLWAVDYHCEKGRTVSTEGSLPEVFPEIRDKYLHMQADDPHGDEVDHVFEVPMALTTALCGYDPTRQDASLSFQVVERRLSGAAGERQEATKAFRDRIAAAVQAELIPLVEALGFVPAHRLSDTTYRPHSPNCLVRLRDRWADNLEFVPSLRGGAASIGIEFFVRDQVKPRGGAFGFARVPPPKRSFMDSLTGKREDAEAGLARSIREAGDLVAALDHHMKDGTPHTHIEPARYFGPAAD